MPESPLNRAEGAKRRRDLVGEVDALVVGHRGLTSAWWYPSQPADRLLVTLEASKTSPGWTEEYEVTEDRSALKFLGAAGAPEGAAGWFAGPSEMGRDPLGTAWMEAGPDRLTVTRQGRIVHQGRAAVAPCETATEASRPHGGFVFTSCQFLALDEDGEQLRDSAVGLSCTGGCCIWPRPRSAAASGSRCAWTWTTCRDEQPRVRRPSVGLYAGVEGTYGGVAAPDVVRCSRVRAEQRTGVDGPDRGGAWAVPAACVRG